MISWHNYRLGQVNLTVPDFGLTPVSALEFMNLDTILAWG